MYKRQQRPEPTRVVEGSTKLNSTHANEIPTTGSLGSEENLLIAVQYFTFPATSGDTKIQYDTAEPGSCTRYADAGANSASAHVRLA